MTEQQQAELLAAWLADENAPIPEGLDAEVVETVLALHPERAPAPRVTAEDILAEVTTGPLAKAPMPSSVAEAPDAPTPANRPWWKWVVLGGGSTVAIAAAGVLTLSVLVLGGTRSLNEPMSEPVAASPAAPSPLERADDDAVVMDAALDAGDAVDTGLVGGEAGRRAAKTAAARPRPAPRPRPKAAAIPEAAPADGIAADFPAGGAAEGFAPVAEEPEAEEKELAFDIVGGGGAASGSAGPRPSTSLSVADQKAPQGQARDAEEAQLREASIKAEEARHAAEEDDSARQYAEEERRRAEDAYAQQARAEAELAKRENSAASAPAPRPAAPPPAAPPPPPSMDALGYVESKPSMDAAEAPAQASRSKPKKYRPSRKVRGQEATSQAIPEVAAVGPRSGTSGVQDARVDQAKALIAASDLAGALETIRLGLDEHPGDSRTRQLLFAMQGDVHQALGDTAAAERAWAEAIAIATRLQ